MKQLIFCFAATFLFISSGFAQQLLKGFEYGNVASPDGKEWENPERLALNKEQPKAYFFSFQNVDAARKVLPENSSYWQSLNGTWKFHWVKHPDERPKDFYKPDYNVNNWDNIPVPVSWNIHGIQKDGSLKYGVPIYVNQPVIFQHKVAVDDWRGGVMRTPPTSWTTYEYRNEVGSFRRDFTVPQNWQGRNVFLNFDGVDNFFYLWINGKYVGFSKNSRNAANFNITKYLQKGKNTIAVEVYRSSDASFLEAQDMFRLPGIFRTVALYSTPQVQISDLVVIPDLDNNYQNGTLNISANVKNFSSKLAKGYKIVYSLYENKLYADDNTRVNGATATATVASINPAKEINNVKAVLKLNNPKQWSAEFPHRYTLIAELKDAANKTIETISTYTGFRKVEIKDTKAEDDEFGLAGRYYYINGKTVKLKGVNRHETNPELGKVVSREQMEKEIMLMKRANINHVRNAHYPDDPYWYYLCDKYGIYLEDEANIESHQYYYGDASLSHPKEWEAAHVARVMEMAHATINNPSVVIWSLGNEAGPGKNFVTAYNALKQFDDSRPVQYERNNNIVDMGSNQYPSISWMRGAVSGKYNIKYPFHVSEYAHSMGNACGNLIDYWEAIESTNFFMGGAIWDWIDQSTYYYDKQTGERYLAYGGDFGDTPNDGQFVMNGLIFADLEPKPQYYEVKKVYQQMGAAALNVQQGSFEIFNKYYFKDLSDYDIQWQLYENGTSVQTGKLNIAALKARDTIDVQLPYQYTALKNDAEYFVKFQFLTKKPSAWAPAGFVEAEEQIKIKSATNIAPIVQVATASAKPKIAQTANGFTTISGNGFSAVLNVNKGTIHSLSYGNEKVIEEGNGPELYALRAFVNNDNWIYERWYENGLHNLKHKVLNSNISQNADGAVIADFTVESQAPNAARIHGGWSSGKNTVEELTNKKFGENDFKFTTNQIWTIYPDGSIELQSAIVSNTPSLVLPRLGYQLKVPEKYANFSYYGRGPIDNYADRKSGQFIELHKSTVAEQFVNFPRPQSMGNHEDVRWCALTDNAGKGAIFIANETFSATALQYNSLDMTLTSHRHKLPKAGDTYLNLDIGVTGLGGNSCGQGAPLEHDRVNAGPHTIGFMIRPTEGKNLSKVASVAPSGLVPLMISRNSGGEVSVTSSKGTADVLYSIDGSQPKNYTSAFDLRNGGVINAWFKNYPQMRAEQRFSKIETVPLTVINASSQETGEGNASNLVDGNPSTIWHTMYSVTVAQYPHWVDLDAGEVKTIKGFAYLPRSGGGNGNIKDFSLSVSLDGKNWGEPVIKSSFANNAELKKVIFEKPVKARYIRFTALSEQRGQDFASGAELSIYAE